MYLFIHVSNLEGCGLLSVHVPYHLWKGGRCYLMERKVVPLLDRVAGRLLCTVGLPMLSMQGSGSSGNTSGPTGFSRGVLGGGDTVRLRFGLGPGSGATGLFIGSLCLHSGVSCWAQWRARLSILLKY